MQLRSHTCEFIRTVKMPIIKCYEFLKVKRVGNFSSRFLNHLFCVMSTLIIGLLAGGCCICYPFGKAPDSPQKTENPTLKTPELIDTFKNATASGKARNGHLLEMTFHGDGTLKKLTFAPETTRQDLGRWNVLHHQLCMAYATTAARKKRCYDVQLTPDDQLLLVRDRNFTSASLTIKQPHR